MWAGYDHRVSAHHLHSYSYELRRPHRGEIVSSGHLMQERRLKVDDLIRISGRYARVVETFPLGSGETRLVLEEV